MNPRSAAACTCIAAALSVGCSATTRHKVLSIWLDGVPAPKDEVVATAKGPAAPALAEAPRQVGFRDHGPYGAKLCGACHEAGATNALVAPRDELCFRCHDLRLNTRYVHGPAASGGCLVCHNPHTSGYAFLLVSDSARFCVRCHDPEVVAEIQGHGGTQGGCTRCHDAHGSDKRFLLK